MSPHRYSDTLTPEQADNIRRRRETELEGFCKAGAVVALLLMLCHFMGVGL